jgi:hypothetical protein
LTKFIYSFVIGISLLLIPQLAYADEVLVELTPDIAYVDTVVDVTGPTEYFIETFTGPRIEIQANGTPTIREGWVDSWIELRQGEVVLRADDDSNHLTGVNEYASKITGTIDTGTYTIRATSYLNRVGYGNPTGVYTLSSNLINAPVPPVEPTPEPTPPPVPEPVAPPIFIDYQPAPAPEPAPEPPAPVEEAPIVVEEPVVEAPEPPVEVEEPPVVVEEPPVEEPTPPAEAEEPPAEVVQADEVELETLAPETPVQLDNGVVLAAGTVVALQLLENPTKLISAIFTNPAQALTALSNIGADMSDEERTTSQNTIIASVIAGQAAINAVGAATMTRTATPTPTGGSAPSANENVKLYRRRKP